MDRVKIFEIRKLDHFHELDNIFLGRLTNPEPEKKETSVPKDCLPHQSA